MKIIIPTTLNDITVRQFQNYNNILNIEDIDDSTLFIGTVSCFCNVSVDDAMQIEVAQLKQIYATILETLRQDPRDIQIYKTFGRIPNIDNITAGEYIDLDKYVAALDDAHKWLAVLFRPIKNKIGSSYTIEKYSGTGEIDLNVYLDFSLEVYLSARVFFWSLGTDLLKATRAYLQQPTAEVQQLAKHLEASGAGINQSIQLLEDAILILQKQPI